MLGSDMAARIWCHHCLNSSLLSPGCGGNGWAALVASCLSLLFPVQAARQLLDGEVLADIVRLHAAVFATLSPGPSPLYPHAPCTRPPVHAAWADPQDASAQAGEVQQSFVLAYQLGAKLLHSLGSASAAEGRQPLLLMEGAMVDEHALGAHLFRCA